MLPLRYALLLAALAALASGWFAYHASGRERVRFYEYLSGRLEKYGLSGYAMALRLRAAEGHLAQMRAARVGRGEAAGAAEAAAGDLVRAAWLLERQDRNTEAVALLRRALQVAPWRADVRARLLEAQIAQGDPMAYSRAFDLAFRREDPQALLLMAQLYIRNGRTEDGLGCLLHAANKLPADFHTQMALAEHLLDAGARKQAVAHATKAWRAATDLAQLLAATEFLRDAGVAVPSRTQIRWSYYLQQFRITLLVVMLYILILPIPWYASLLHRARVDLRARRFRAAL